MNPIVEENLVSFKELEKIFSGGLINISTTLTCARFSRISRYLGRPVIATSRIDSYDGEYVTFHISISTYKCKTYPNLECPINKKE